MGSPRFATGEGPVLNKTVELKALHRDGHSFPVEATIWALKIEMGWSFNSFLRDISERTHAEQARATAASELAHANHRLEIRNREVEEYSKFVRDFVAAASHELRTPLTSIMGYLEVVLESEEDGLGASQRRDLDIVYRNSQRLLSLVADLLTVNKIESGSLSLELQATRPSDLLETVAEAYRPVCEEKTLELVVDEAGDIPIVIVDRFRMHQVLGNLVGNAVKFTPPGGQVRISAVAVDGNVELRVADTGMGIAPEELPKIFDRFFRSSSSQKMALPGTGLGLAIAKAMVEGQGGRLSVMSRREQGSTFTIAFPAGDAGAVRGPQPAPHNGAKPVEVAG